MTTFTIKGRVALIGETKAVGQNGFVKRELVVDLAEEGSKYPNPVKVTLKKDKTALADQLHNGDEVEVDITIDGRRWDGPNGAQYFTDITGWRVRTTGAAEETAPDEGGDVLPF